MATRKNSKDELIEQLTAVVNALSAKVDQLSGQQADAKVARTGAKGQPRPTVSYEVTGFFRENQPPQCRKLSRWAFDATRELDHNITEPELAAVFQTHEDQGEWRYGQTTWEVWAYYRPRMISAGHVRQIG